MHGTQETQHEAHQVSKSETPACKTELIVYWCHSVERGPEQRVFDEDDIQGAGGINNVETELQRDSYWFARLGAMDVQQSARGWPYTDEAEEAIAALPEPCRGNGGWAGTILRSGAERSSATSLSHFSGAFQRG